MGERLFKRGRIWYAHVREPSGQWVKVSTRCTDKVAAEATRRRLERELADPTVAAEATATLTGILSDYLRSRVTRKRAAGTVEHVRQKSNALVTHLPQRLADVTHQRCEKYIESRQEDGVENTTIKKELRVLKAALGLARKNGLFARDPSSVIPELEDSYTPRQRWVTPWELVALCVTLPEHRAAHVCWIVALGARWSESVRAQRADVKRPLTLLRGTKTEASWREVPVTSVMDSVLSWAMDRAGKTTLFARWSNVRRDLLDACKTLGIPAVSPNDLRRTFSQWHRQAGIEPSLLAPMLGHTSTRMVERVYGKLAPKDLNNAVVSRLLAAAPPPQSTGTYVGGQAVDSGSMMATLASDFAENTCVLVPRPRVELGTRGFSIPANFRFLPAKPSVLRQRGQYVGVETYWRDGSIRESWLVAREAVGS